MRRLINAIGRFFLFLVGMEESKNLGLDLWTHSVRVLYKENTLKERGLINRVNR